MRDRFSNHRFGGDPSFPKLPPLPGPPLFFKLWFGFIAVIMLAMIGVFIYLAVAVVQAGPEGVGQTIGSIVRGFNEAVDQR